uniref:Uncharacterized protein n=1 Tax=Sphaerodactylus townsendi TaxID=933632 RepID=A0ACB8ES98_9SAUR
MSAFGRQGLDASPANWIGEAGGSPAGRQLGSEGEAATGDGWTGPPQRRGSDALQRYGADAEGLAGRPLPRREPGVTSTARPADGTGDAALPGSSGMMGRARRSGGRRSRQGEGPLRNVGGGEGIKGEERSS